MLMTLLLVLVAAIGAFAAGWSVRGRMLLSRSKQVEDRLEMVDRALASAGAGMYIVRPEKNEVECSRSTLALRGLQDSGEATTTLSLSDWISVIHPDDFEMVRSARETRRDRPQADVLEYRIRMPDGQYRWARAYSEPHFEAGKFHALYGLMLDITTIKNLEAKLRARDERLRDASAAGSVFTWELDLSRGLFLLDTVAAPGPDGKLPPSVFETFQITVDALIAMHHPDDREQIRAMIEKVRHEGVPYMTEGRMIHAPGEPYLWTLAQGRVVVDPVTGVRCVRGTAQNIDQRKQAALKLKEAEARLERAIRAANDGLWEIDVKTGKAWVSERFAEMLDYIQADFTDDPGLFMKCAHPDDREMVTRVINEHVANGRQFDLEVRKRTRGGDWRWFRVRGLCERDADGKPMKISGSEQDITDKKRYQIALIEATQAAASANSAKSEFLANMSHEIRTPMNGVIGMTELLLETPMNAMQRDYAETVRDSARALLTVINDILDFSKVEAGKLELEHLDFDMRDTVEDVARLLSIQAHAKRLEVTALIDPKLPDVLKGDAGRVRQILINLGGNAVKFTQEGEIAIDIKVLEHDAEHYMVRCEVRDTGVGIPADRVKALFQPFTQVDASTTRQFGGTGLGLSIVRRLAALMNGDTGVSSEEGKGSTFWFTARFGVSSTASALRRPSPTQLRGQFVLVVDDNATNRKVLTGQLALCGINAVCVSSAEEALSTMRQAHEVGKQFSVALLDHQMPGCDGAQLGRQIVADETLKETRLVLLTSSGQRGDSHLFANIGFAGYLLKPVGQRDLVDCLMLVLGADAQSWHMRSQPIITRHALRSHRAGVRPHILLAEDNVVNQKVACRTLEKLGYRVDVAADGQAAVNAWESGRYDLILMDCQMPVLDGYEATREIRRREPAGKRIPIVALTAHAMKGADVACKEAGMDDHLTKPVNRNELDACLHRYLSEPLPEVTSSNA